MKIRIITFHCPKNYGAALQAYALKSILFNYSKNVSFINYKPEFLTAAYTPIYQRISSYLKQTKNYVLIRLIKSAIQFVHSFFQYHFWGYKERINAFCKFEKNFLEISLPVFTTGKEIMDFDADYIFIGSDQVWNAKMTKCDTVYFGDFPRKPGSKLIAYAASIGLDSPGEDTIKLIKDHINNFDAISVREESAKNILTKYCNCNKEVYVTLDPTLLLNSSEWRKISVAPKESGYLLLYQMSKNKLTEHAAKEIAHRMGLKVIEILPGPRILWKRYGHKVYVSASPEEYVGFFENADFVVTSSFHGTAFSLIFNKQFYTVPHKTAGSRMVDLLSSINLQNRLLFSINDIDRNDAIDYVEVNSMIEVLKKESIAFIEHSLDIK